MRRTPWARLAAAFLVVACLGIAGCSAKSLSALVNSKPHHKTHAKQHSRKHHKGHKGHKKAHAKPHRRHHARPHPRHHPKPKPAVGGPDALVVEPSGGFSTVYQLINHARHSIDVTMFEFADTTAEHDLGAAAKRGVNIRVILDQREHSTNSDAYSYFKSHGIKVVWSSTKFEYTHQKTLTFDNSVSMVESANLTQRYYATSRDFLVKDTNAADVAAIVRVFNADFAHHPITPGDGHDLVWSPTDSERQILSVINGAKKSLRVYSEEMGFSTVIDALEAAAKRGVNVQVCGENSGSQYTRTFEEMARKGVHISYFSSSTGFYIHAKVVLADYGTSRERAFIGSENFSNTSLNRNRELGLITSAHSMLSPIVKVFGADFAKGHQVK
ncbi:MAG TPA: phospholipase D-like domain-containing protein [Streptosporangiaceae bacterium]|nr:phospholipase D-like domain-containing protein [Streptosporangiaceae bacterium]